MAGKKEAEHPFIKALKIIGLLVAVYVITFFLIGLLYGYGPFDLEPYRNIAFTIWLTGPLVVLLAISFINTVVFEKNLEKKQHYFTRLYSMLISNLIISTPKKSVPEKLYILRGLNLLDIRFGKALYKVAITAIYVLLSDIIFLFICAGLQVSLDKVSPIILGIFFASLFTILCVPMITFAIRFIRENTLKNMAEKEMKLNSTEPFRLDFALRKKYLRLPRAIFWADTLTLVVIILSMSIFPNDIFYKTTLGYFCSALLLVSIFGWIPSACYLGICSGRSYTQQLQISDDQFIYVFYSGSGDSNRAYKGFTFTEIYSYKVGPRAILLKGDGKRFSLWIPRTFTDEARLIQFFDEHLVSNR